MTLRFVPAPGTLESAIDEARRLGITIELWVRLLIDAHHVLGQLARLGIAERAAIAAAFDDEARADNGTDVAAISAGNRDYLRALRSRHGGDRPSKVLELLVPEDLAGAWRLAAIGSDVTLETWMEANLARERAGAPLTWETAAAEAHLSLREWCYASFASRIARRTASPSLRTAANGLLS